MIEAWAPSAAACLEEAVTAFVDVFAEARPVVTGAPSAEGEPARAGPPAGAVPAQTAVPFDVGPGGLPDLLVLLLEEVLYLVEVVGRVPIAADVAVHGDRLTGRFATVPAGSLVATGAVPKGVSYGDLEIGPVGEGWRCRATVDV